MIIIIIIYRSSPIIIIIYRSSPQVCLGYLRPDTLDPKMLDPKHVFEQVDVSQQSGNDTTFLT